MTNNLISSVRAYLKSNHMLVDEEWLLGCVEYLTEDGNNTYSEQEVANLTKEQWLLNDLKNICPGSLPTNLKSKNHTRLNDRYVLQINSAIDIATPAYQQYLKIKKVNMENIEATIKFEDKITCHRMVKLYMTDGVQEVCGIEYKPMRNLCHDITPGSKILIKGPVECRKGIMLLTEGAIELLGGEVQEMSESNSLAGLLSSKLGVPSVQDVDINSTSNLRSADIPTPYPKSPTRNHLTIAPPLEQSRPNNVATVTSLQGTNFGDEDIDMDQLAAIEQEFVNSSKRSMNDDFIKPEKKLKTSTSATSFEYYPPDEDLFSDDDYLNEIDANNKPEQSASVKTVFSYPFVYIKQINEMNKSERIGAVFKVKAQIIKLLSKLSVSKDGWSLRCTIVDGSGSIDLDFTSDVLSKLVGFTPQEMNEIKKQIATNPAMKEKTVFALQKARDTLQVLYCIIEITIFDTPKITNLIPFEEYHVDLLRSRQDSRL